ncbi:hypothetical protein CPB85DRAFT_535212 [Mucidula mucida]|nr:hypothetical protein CPB85DRAFT_535212 [Mucidula mucida]
MTHIFLCLRAVDRYLLSYGSHPSIYPRKFFIRKNHCSKLSLTHMSRHYSLLPPLFPLATTIPSCHHYSLLPPLFPLATYKLNRTGHVHSTAIPSRASGQPCSLRRCPLRKLIGLYPSWRSHWRPRRRQVR